MHKLIITMADGSQYEKEFSERYLIESFLAKLEMFEGLFVDLNFGEPNDPLIPQVRINPKFIMKIEQERMFN